MNTTLIGLVTAALFLAGSDNPAQDKPSAAKEGTLLLRSMGDWPIVVDEAAIPSEKYAAEEFQRLFKDATGLSLAIAGSAGPNGAVYVGTGKAMLAGQNGFDVTALGDEGLRIRIGGDSIVIAGGRPRGTLYGVYEFFETCLGARFLTQDHTYMPKGLADKALSFADITGKPTFSFRWPFYKENSDNPAFAARLRANTVTPDERLGGNTPQTLINHSICNYLPVKTYGKDHPEYFALVNGERKLDVEGGGPQVCVTNPSVIDIVSEAVNRALDANPTARNISVSQMDNGEYCHCDACEAINKREGSTMGAHMAFVNAVAERVAVKHPGVMVGTLAYQYTRKPPKALPARDNVQIQLCSIECCTIHAINDPNCKRNQEFCADLTAWRDKCKDIRIWNYNTNFRAYDLPFPNLRSIDKNLKFFRDNGVTGVFMQANGNGNTGEMCDLRNYVIAKCLWDPSRDGWQLVEEFCRLHYAKAAPPILAYLTLLHDNAQALGVHPGCFPTEGEVGLSADIAKQAYAKFEEARQLAKSDAVRARVEKASICAFKALLSTVTELKYDAGVCKQDLSAIAPNLVDRYIDLCRRYGMSMASEERPAEEYFKELKRLEAGIPAIKLENRVWRVVVLPEDNGRIVDMTYKATGRNLVASPARSFPRWRSHEEWSAQGPNPQKPSAFTAEITGNKLALKKTLSDGSVMRRSISLASDESPTIDFETVIEGSGPEKRVYELSVHPEYDAAGYSEDPNVVSAYVKAPGWIHANKDWDTAKSTGPNAGHMGKTDGGAFAYYNHAGRFGVVQTYAPKSFAQQSLYWSPGRHQVTLTLQTPAVALGKGEELRYGYSVGYLTEAPK